MGTGERGRRRACPCRVLCRLPRRVELPILSRPPAKRYQVSEQHQPHLQQRQRPASFPQCRAPAPVLRLTPWDPPLRGAPGIPGQTLLNWTQSSARNQASGLFLPTQTSTSTKIFQAGRAAFSRMDSSRFESLPDYIFNVLTYALHGPGLTEAPPYR